MEIGGRGIWRLKQEHLLRTTDTAGRIPAKTLLWHVDLAVGRKTDTKGTAHEEAHVITPLVLAIKRHGGLGRVGWQHGIRPLTPFGRWLILNCVLVGLERLAVKLNSVSSALRKRRVSRARQIRG